MRHHKGKSEFRAQRGSASQVSTAAGSSFRWETVHMEPFWDPSRPESTCDPADMSHMDTHAPRLGGASVTSNQLSCPKFD